MRKAVLLAAASTLAGVAAPAFAQAERIPVPDGQVGPATPEAEQAAADSPAANSPELEPEIIGLEGIIVTAQRREESVQDVPIAISAFTSRELALRGVTNALDVAQYVPNLVGLNNTGLGSANAYYLRGLGNTETVATFDPPVGTYVDDIYLSRQNANNLSLFDVERLEVLRGPQGTLFGRNTTGGAINLILAEPGNELGGYAEVGTGSYEAVESRASVDLPVTRDVALKLSGFYHYDQGYVRNTTTGERLNDNDGYGGRLGFRAELSPNARYTASYMHIDSRAENSLNFACDPADPTNCDGRFATTGLLGAEGQFVGLITGPKQFYGNFNRTDTDIITSNLQFGSTDLRLNIITGYVNTTDRYGLDFADGRALPSLAVPVPPVLGFTRGGFTIVNDANHEQITQELKLTGRLFNGFVDFVGGAYYYKEDNVTDFADLFSLALPTAPPPRGFPLLLADRTLLNSTEAYAGYLQADFNLTDRIKLTAGVRYTDETKTFSISDNRPVVGTNAAGQALCRGPNQFGPGVCLTDANLIAANGRPIPQRLSTNLFTPRFVAAWEPIDDLNLYVSATRGFKSGGWNARGTTPGALLPFGPEKVWSYEAGVKSELFQRRLRVNAVAYRMDVTDLQTPSALADPVTGALTFLTRNFADYRNQGLELEVSAAPLRGLNLFFAGGYQNDEYRLDSGGLQVDAFGVQSVLAQQAACRAQLARGLIPSAGAGEATSCGVGIVTAEGRVAEPVRTPDFTLAWGGSYVAELGALTLTPSLNASWRSKSEVQTSNLTFYNAPITSSTGRTFPANPYGTGAFITGSDSGSSWIVNATLTLADVGRRFALIGECTNCFDEVRVESALANTTYLNQPRRVMVRARVNF